MATETFKPRHWSQDEVCGLPTDELSAVVRSTNPTGFFAGEVVWARDELKRRGESA